MPNWDWLKDYKERARRVKQQTAPAMANNTVMSLAERYNIGAKYPNDTGYGEDGRLQTSMPVAKFNTANGEAMVHEGEQLRNLGNGNVRVVSQAELLEEEKRKTTPGYKCGGIMRYEQGGIMKGYQQGGVMPNPIPDPFGVNKKKNVKPNPMPDPLPDPFGIGKKKQKVDPIPVNPGGGPQNFNINPNTNINQVNPIQNIDPNTNINQVNPIKPIGPTAGGIGNLPGPVTPIPQVDPSGVQTLPGQQVKPGPNAIGGPISPDKPVDETDIYEQQFQDALGRIGQMGGYEKERQKWLDQQAAQQATEELVQRQRSAQRGIGGVEAQTLDLMQQRMHGQESAGAYADTAIGAMNLAEQANIQKAQLAFQGMNYATAKEQWQKQFGLSEQQWNDTFGFNQQQFEESKKQWQKQFDFAKQQYGDQQGALISSLVNQGHSLEYIRSKFPDANITEEAYKQMQDWSPTGINKDRWDYSKKVDTFNQLMQQGGAENFKEAAKMFNDMFGTNIDFSNALTEENRQKFNSAWNNMSGSIASGMNFEDWVKSAKADGTFDNLNMTESDIKSMYNNMKMQSNPMYQAMQQYDALLENGDISQDEYDRVMRALRFGLSNPEGFEFGDAFQVVDENGNEVGYFKSQEEAEKYIQENPDKNFSFNQIPDGWVDYSGSGTGPGGGTNTNPDPNTDPIGYEQDLQQNFDTFTGGLPDKYYSEGLDPETWDLMGRPDANKYAAWYDNSGGKEYLKVKDVMTGLTPDLAKELDDYNHRKGRYKDRPVGSVTDENAGLRSILLKSGYSEEELKEAMRGLKEFARSQGFDEQARVYGDKDGFIKKLTDKGWSEKAAQDAFETYKSFRTFGYLSRALFDEGNWWAL